MLLTKLFFIFLSILSVVGFGQDVGDKLIIKKSYFSYLDYVFDHDSSFFFFGQTNSSYHGSLSGTANTDITILRTNYVGDILNDITIYNHGSDQIDNVKLGKDGFFYIAVSNYQTDILNDNFVRIIKTDGISLHWETRIETFCKDMFILNDAILIIGNAKEINERGGYSILTNSLDFFVLDFKGNIRTQKKITCLTSIIDEVGRLGQMKFFLSKTNEKKIGIIASIELSNSQSSKFCPARTIQSTSTTFYIKDLLFFIDSSFNLIQDFKCFESNADEFSITYNENSDIISSLGSIKELDENKIDYRNPFRITFQMFNFAFVKSINDLNGKSINTYIFPHSYDTVWGFIESNDTIGFLIVRNRNASLTKHLIGLKTSNKSINEFIRFSISEERSELSICSTILKDGFIYIFGLQNNDQNYSSNLYDVVFQKVKIINDL
ncbi:MAG: hypothetical protein FD170_1603 [Bacteroidetes bacterium]|nr:MAG: hypothetical protein FD170_1603 [Bacteroidota bacterium]